MSDLRGAIQGEGTSDVQPTILGEIERYLATGESDPLRSAWPGSRFLERARSASRREALANEFGERFRPGDARVDAREVAEVVLEAAGRRNGWRVILGRCAPASPSSSR